MFARVLNTPLKSPLEKNTMEISACFTETFKLKISIGLLQFSRSSALPEYLNYEK